MQLKPLEEDGVGNPQVDEKFGQRLLKKQNKKPMETIRKLEN